MRKPVFILTFDVNPIFGKTVAQYPPVWHTLHITLMSKKNLVKLMLHRVILWRELCMNHDGTIFIKGYARWRALYFHILPLLTLDLSLWFHRITHFLGLWFSSNILLKCSLWMYHMPTNCAFGLRFESSNSLFSRIKFQNIHVCLMLEVQIPAITHTSCIHSKIYLL